MYLKQHESQNVDINEVPFDDLTKSIEQNLVERHKNLLYVAKQLPVLAIVREPLVRFVASYKDKIERSAWYCIILYHWYTDPQKFIDFAEKFPSSTGGLELSGQLGPKNLSG